MDDHAFSLLRQSEATWWYSGRALIIKTALRRAGLTSTASALDFGAGYGGMHDHIRMFAKDVYAYEPEPHAAAESLRRGYTSVITSLEEALGQKYGLICLFDVVEHVEDDHAYLEKIRDALTADGRVAITVPAYQFLWSRHDEANKHFRRYTRRSMIALLKRSGFEIEFAGYWNTILFPLALIARVMNFSGESAFGLPPLVNRAFFACVTVEAFLMRLFPMPFGVSVVVVARRR